MDKNTMDLIGLSMLGMMDDPVIKDMLGAQLVTDTNPDNDLLGMALMMKEPNIGIFNHSILNKGV